ASNIGYFTVAVEDCIRPSDPARMDDAVKYLSMTSTMKKSTDLIEIWDKSTPRPSAAPTSTASAASSAAMPQTPTIAHEGRQIPNTTEEILNPQHTALV